MVTRLDIIQRAQVQIGSEPIQSEAEDGADTHIKTYDRIVEFIYSLHPWFHCTHTVQLARLTETPAGEWDYQFQLPSDRNGPPWSVSETESNQAPLQKFELQGSVLLADVLTVWARYQKKPDPLAWPGYFRELVTLAIAAEFAASIREDHGLRDNLRRDAYGTPSDQYQGGLVGTAKLKDAQGKPSPIARMHDGPLINARFQ